MQPSKGSFPLDSPAGEPGEPAGAGTPRDLSLRLRFRSSGLEAVLRLSWLGLRVTLRHAFGALHDALRPDGREGRRARRLERSAEQTAAVLGALKGAFAKAGQFAASRPDLASPQMQAALARLRDHVPPIPFRQVRAVIEAELGRPLVDVFARVHMRPLGAASIAQVHLARLHDGDEVAVKVQYPWLRPALRADLLLLRVLVSTWLRYRGSNRAAALRLFDEFAASLQDELDFEHEARIAGQIAANLADEPRVIVPRVHTELSTARVLVLERSYGVPLSEGAALRQEGIQPRAVLDVLVRAYARQIFVDGLFHADPHPGNLFALPDPEDPQHPRVVFLDFGLSRRLDLGLKRAIREAVFAVLKRDVDAFMVQMGALDMIAPGAEPGVRAAVEAMFEHMRSSGAVLEQSGSQVLALKDHAKTLLRDTPGLQLPTDLLLYAKTLSYLFALGESLDPEVDMMKLTVPHLLRFLAATN
jgi:ubiquinone biosynthesis protein